MEDGLGDLTLFTFGTVVLFKSTSVQSSAWGGQA